MKKKNQSFCGPHHVMGIIASVAYSIILLRGIWCNDGLTSKIYQNDSFHASICFNASRNCDSHWGDAIQLNETKRIDKMFRFMTETHSIWMGLIARPFITWITQTKFERLRYRPSPCHGRFEFIESVKIVNTYFSAIERSKPTEILNAYGLSEPRIRGLLVDR